MKVNYFDDTVDELFLFGSKLWKFFISQNRKISPNNKKLPQFWFKKEKTTSSVFKMIDFHSNE